MLFRSHRKGDQLSNSLGNIFKITSFGESHGKCIGVVVDGCPAGLQLDLNQIQEELNRRKPGQSNISTSREEKDKVEITLTPKEEIEIYKKITVTIHSKKFEINAIAIIDETGSESKFEFDKIEINKKISKNLFEFNPPEGTTIDEY